MLRLLERLLYEKDSSRKNSVGIYVEINEDNLLLHCASRGRSSAEEPTFFEQSLDINNINFDKSHSKLENSLLYVSFSALEFKFIKMHFDNIPLKTKEQKKFLFWRLAQDWGIHENEYLIRYFVIAEETGYQVLVHACDIRVQKSISKVAELNQALVVQSRPQIVRELRSLFSSESVCESNGIIFYLQRNCWSIASWSTKSEIDFLRSQPIQSIFGVTEAFQDFKSLYEKRVDENECPPGVYIAYDPNCGLDLRVQIKKLLEDSTLSAEELSRESDFDYPSWQLRYADYAISI